VPAREDVIAVESGIRKDPELWVGPGVKLKSRGVQEELLNSGNARNQKIIKILTLKCLKRGSRQAQSGFFESLATHMAAWA
jgi:hypothetical protein